MAVFVQVQLVRSRAELPDFFDDAVLSHDTSCRTESLFLSPLS